MYTNFQGYNIFPSYTGGSTWSQHASDDISTGIDELRLWLHELIKLSVHTLTRIFMAQFLWLSKGMVDSLYMFVLKIDLVIGRRLRSQKIWRRIKNLARISQCARYTCIAHAHARWWITRLLAYVINHTRPRTAIITEILVISGLYHGMDNADRALQQQFRG